MPNDYEVEETAPPSEVENYPLFGDGDDDELANGETGNYPLPGDEEGRAAKANDNDPLEGLNRAFFAFNVRFDDYMLAPLARGWKDLPREFTDRVHNAFANVAEPVSIANHTLQLDSRGIGNGLARLLLNLTVGLGVFDVASAVGVGGGRTDLGITLGKWGMGDGPYLVAPFIGPSSPRDLFGFFVDERFGPLGWAEDKGKITFFEYAALKGTDTVDKRAAALKPIERLRSSSLDFYAAMRSAYQQHRAALVKQAN